jgi:thiamine monophosphate synthase
MCIDAARLHVVIDARPDIAEAVLRGGVGVVQLRERSTPAAIT